MRNDRTPELPRPHIERVVAFLLGHDPSTRFIVGDLREEFAAVCRARRRRQAALWYLVQVLRLGLRVCWERVRRRDADESSYRTLPPGDLMNTELRQALQFLWRRPAFSGAIVLTVAIAIAATTLTFAIVNGVLRLTAMRPNGIVEADRRAVQSYAAGENSYRSSIVKELDGPAA